MLFNLSVNENNSEKGIFTSRNSRISHLNPCFFYCESEKLKSVNIHFLKLPKGIRECENSADLLDQERR